MPVVAVDNCRVPPVGLEPTPGGLLRPLPLPLGHGGRRNCIEQCRRFFMQPTRIRHTGHVGERDGRVSSRAVLRNVEFRAVFFAGGLSVLGDQLARIAIALLVYERSGSALAASAIYACSYLTWLLGGPLLSALADRYRRRRVMVVSDVARTVLVALLALPGVPLWTVFAVLILVGLLAPPFEAARSALLADVLEGEAYLRGNTLNQTVFQFGQVLGFAVGGALVALIGVRGALLSDALTFGVSAALIVMRVQNRPAAPRTTDVRPSLLRETWLGARLVGGSPRLRRLLVWALLSTGVVIAPEGLAVAVSDDLGGKAVAAGLLTAAVPLGFVLGSFALNRVGPARRERLFAPLVLLSVVPLAVTPLLHTVWAVVLAWTVAGLGNALQLIANAAYVQAVPGPLRGRAFGIAVTGLMGVQGVVLLSAGAIGDALGARQSVALIALFGLALTPLAALSGRGESAALAPDTSRRRRVLV